MTDDKVDFTPIPTKYILFHMNLKVDSFYMNADKVDLFTRMMTRKKDKA